VSHLRKCSLLVALALIAAVPAATAHAAAPRSSGAICGPIRASGVGQDLGEGRTQATISSHGHVIGHTKATFAIGQVDGTKASFTGPITFTSAIGTLTAQVAGTFDVASGAFSATSTSLTRTGLLRHTTGSVTLAGNEDFATGSFTETITGRLCLGG